MTGNNPAQAFELVLREVDGSQAVYEYWVSLSGLRHGFHRYNLVSGAGEVQGTSNETDLSIARHLAGVITRAYQDEGELPQYLRRDRW